MDNLFTLNNVIFYIITYDSCSFIRVCIEYKLKLCNILSHCSTSSITKHFLDYETFGLIDTMDGCNSSNSLTLRGNSNSRHVPNLVQKVCFECFFALDSNIVHYSALCDCHSINMHKILDSHVSLTSSYGT